MGAALVAVIDRARRHVRLDPQVRPGTRLAYDGEALLLHTTSTGHCAETADYLARMLRRSGWRVTVAPVDETPAVVGSAFLGPGMMPDASVDALMLTIGPAPGHLLTERRERPHQPRGGGSLFVCLVCGHATRGTHHVESHRRNRSHHDYERLPEADALALQARVRAARAQEGAPELREAPPAATG